MGTKHDRQADADYAWFTLLHNLLDSVPFVIYILSEVSFYWPNTVLELIFTISHTRTHTLSLSFSPKSNSIHIIYFGMIYFLLHRMKHCCWFFSDTISHIHTQKCQNQQQSRNRLKIDFQFVDNIHVHRLHKWKDVMCAIFSWTYTVCFRNKYHPLWY